ncbi:MAG: M3 family metallopeptidase, partial [Bacillota bacterium]|nr:M3 family metallopeptidase [Bacillota bacterium]
LGHACHGMLASQHQSILQTRSGLFFVEAPSTGHEVFLGNYLLSREKDPRRRIHIIQAFMGTFIHNMVTHLLQGHLERRLYRLAEKGRPITLSIIRQEQRAVYEGFFGDAVTVDEVDELAWMTVPHYYTGLYPYTYAAGLSCGVAVAQRVLQEGAPVAEDWLTALKMGGTAFPLDLMARAGVDLRDPETLRQGAREFGKLVTELEELSASLD